jgi:hypothetical protein
VEVLTLQQRSGNRAYVMLSYKLCCLPPLLLWLVTGKETVQLPLSFEWDRVTKLFGENHCYIGWSDLQIILADALPSNVVQFGVSYQR